MSSRRRSTRRSSSAQRGEKIRKRSRTGLSAVPRRSKRGKSADRITPELEPEFEPSEVIPEGNEQDIEETNDLNINHEEDFPGDDPSASLDKASLPGSGRINVTRSEGLRQRRRNTGNSGSVSSRQSVDLPQSGVWLRRWEQCKPYILPVFLVAAVVILFIAITKNTHPTVGLNVESIYSKLKVEINSRTEQMRSLTEKRIGKLEEEIKQIGEKHKDEALKALLEDKGELTKQAANRALMNALNEEDFKKSLEDLISARIQDRYDKIVASVNEAHAKIDDMGKKIREREGSILEARKKLEQSATEIRNKCLKDIQTKESELKRLIEETTASAVGNTNEQQLKLWIEDNLTAIVDQLIQEDLEKYSADRTGLVDYALRAAGGKIEAHSQTETNLVKRTNILKYLGSHKVVTQPPVLAIMPGTSWGQSWAMHGNKGFLLIKLSKVITPTFFSLEHISHLINPNPAATPKFFRVYGTNTTAVQKSDKHEPLWDKKYPYLPYDRSGRSLQQYNLTTSNRYQYIYFDIRDNYGGNYTTIYRVRVHGNP
uniref:SUN domain-containing protein n=1 Tax=Lotharella oceanica TaxID=641309 RepID=A0A7S2TPV2_9EUKA|mmetsp:Transcript_22312/g.41895  ORF Transcript_22312/g.41895 Transcript_22312/m.41895 type:complete len:543 (+) Transcript_22312:28-1656(+)